MYEKIGNDCKEVIRKSPPGKLRISATNGRPSFYLRNNNAPSSEDSYCSKIEMKLIKGIAQKEYCEELLRVIEKRLKKIERILGTYQEDELIKVYEDLNVHRKGLVQPYMLPFEEFAEEWLNLDYPKREFAEDDPEILTEKGERVLSKSEKIIADKLNMLGIPYRYEYPLQITNGIIFHPDFTLLHPKTRKVWIWEHMGKMDDPDYVEKAIRKIEIYAQQGYFPGINLILTHESSKRPLNMRIVIAMLKAYEFI